MPGKYYTSAWKRTELPAELGGGDCVAKVKHVGTVNERGKEFLKLFNQLTYSRSAWQVWEDLVTVMACSICNAIDRRKEPFERRERQYERSIKNLGGVDIPAQMFGIVTMALEENPNQDFLGQLYMNLNLGSHWHGQFFTPYHISELMAKMTIGEDCQKEIEEKGYISVCDQCVGAGAMLIAAANVMKEAEINYLQTSIANLETSISKKEEELKERMYSMQSYMNNNSYIDFIFGASDFSDMFSRIESINELTSYDKELVSQLSDEKKQVESQKATVVSAKANIETQRASKKSLQEQFQALYLKQNAEAIAQEKAALQAKNSSEKIDDNLAAFAAAVKESELPSGSVVSGNSEIGNAIANKALSKRGSVYVYGACHSMSEIANPNQSTFDCSGLVSWAFYQAGVNIGSNSTKTLAKKGISVSRSSMQAGDIILFSKNGSASGIHHVGIYIGGGNMVHAPQTGDVVKIASLSSGYYQANWYDVRRLY